MADASGQDGMIGRLLGHCRVLEKIGAGGMGEVYRARDEHLDREVAIKVLPPGMLSDECSRKRFHREALALSKLNHPNVATIHDFDTQQEADFLVMEYIPGVTLDDCLAKGPLLEKEVVALGLQLAEGLSAAHERGIIHRDLKPSNLRLTTDRRLKILDFGLAKLQLPVTANSPTASFSGTHTIAGTLRYMAPEQALGEKVDARTDIHAAGLVLYEMATGKRAFAEPQDGQLLNAVLHHRPVAPRQLNRKLSPELERIVDKCLEKDPEDRYQSAKELAVDLHRLEHVSQTGPAASPPHARRTLALFHRSRRTRLALAASVMVLLAVFAALYFGRLRAHLGGSPQIHSLAVLPLENLSGDPEQDYLASGMHEALITDLSKLTGIRKVIARASVMRYQKTDQALPKIARELGVDALVTGSVLRSGDRLQITAHLFDATTNQQLWADRYARQSPDVLALENDVVQAITRSIGLQLTPGEQARPTNVGTVNPEAYEAYLRGRFHWRRQTREDYDVAERNFQFAIQRDPNFAPAYAGLGAVWMMRGDAGFQPPSETFPKGMEFLKKAVAIDDSSAEVHVWLANALDGIEWDWAGAEREYQRAIELNSNLAEAHFFYADMLLATKRSKEWAPEMHRARELDPLNQFNESFYGWHLNYLHRYDEAIAIFRKLLPTVPNKATNYLGLWGAYYKKGMYAEALSAARGYFAAAGEPEFAGPLGTCHDRATYEAAMRRVGTIMEAQSKQEHVPAIRIARMFAHAGDTDPAIHWLEIAYQNRESPLIRMAVFWDWDSLRSDPRFQDLLRRMNLPQ